MKTCELCGERPHDGPCYADLREEWRQQDIKRFFECHKWEIRDFPEADVPMTFAFKIASAIP